MLQMRSVKVEPDMKIYAYQHNYLTLALQLAAVASGATILFIGIVGAWL
jgi:hypothetical protein